MPASDAVARTLDVPGARLYYERQGAGPLLLLIGSPMDSAGFVRLARIMAGWYTVVTYDPRGIGHSTREDTAQDITPEQQADDVHRLLSALGGGPADIFGSSGGAVVGLALVAAHPERQATLRAAAEVFLAHLLRPTTNYRPDIEALQSAPTRVVVAVGATSQGQLAHRGALALADRLATPATEFPGDHAGFVIHPVKCARVLHQLLTHPT